MVVNTYLLVADPQTDPPVHTGLPAEPHIGPQSDPPADLQTVAPEGGLQNHWRHHCHYCQRLRLTCQALQPEGLCSLKHPRLPASQRHLCTCKEHSRRKGNLYSWMSRYLTRSIQDVRAICILGQAVILQGAFMMQEQAVSLGLACTLTGDVHAIDALWLTCY